MMVTLAEKSRLLFSHVRLSPSWISYIIICRISRRATGSTPVWSTRGERQFGDDVSCRHCTRHSIDSATSMSTSTIGSFACVVCRDALGDRRIQLDMLTAPQVFENKHQTEDSKRYGDGSFQASCGHSSLTR